MELNENITQTDPERFPARKGLKENCFEREAALVAQQTAIPQELTPNFKFKNSNYRPSKLNKPSVL